MLHLLLLINTALSILAAVVPRADKNTPMTTSDRWILDSNGKRFKLRCASWPGHLETNLPEGLQHQSIDHITSWIASTKLNCIRITYSIDMTQSPSLSVKDAFSNAASAANVPLQSMMDQYDAAVKNNPFLATASILDVYHTLITSLDKANIKVILDNHVSKAGWCCSQSDMNGWFNEPIASHLTSIVDHALDNSKYFDIGKWLDGLGVMADFAKAHSSNVIGMSIRNELRPYIESFSIDSWRKYVGQAAGKIHSTNPDLLVFIGGLNYAHDLSFVHGNNLDRSSFANKAVWEYHTYIESHDQHFAKRGGDSDCKKLQKSFGKDAGFVLEGGNAFTGPLWVSEFGINTANPSQAEKDWVACLADYFSSNDADWSIWTLGGSYYVREGNVGADESFGLLDREWNDWRNKDFPGLLGDLWKVTQGPGV